MDEGMNSFAGIGEAAVIDCETTGFDPGTDRIITVAVIRADFSRLDRGTRLTGDSLVVEVNPGVPIPEAATAVHGLRDADVAGWPPFADEAQELRDFIGDRVLVGHNAQFDKRFLNAEFKRAGVETLRRKAHCTMRRFREESGQAKGSRLEDVARAMGLDGRRGQAHDALEDAQIAMRIAGRFYRADTGREWLVMALPPSAPYWRRWPPEAAADCEGTGRPGWALWALIAVTGAILFAALSA